MRGQVLIETAAGKQEESGPHVQQPLDAKPPTRVLLSAFACFPGIGSEPGVGWDWAVGLARRYDVWVMTTRLRREVVTEHAAAATINWIFVDPPAWLAPRPSGRLSLEWYYLVWQWFAFLWLRRHAAEHRIDLVHHVTLGRYWCPFLPALLPVPCVFGPVGGGDCTPRSLIRSFSLRGRLFEYLREFMRTTAAWNPLITKPARRIDAAVAATEATAECLRRIGCRRVETYPQCGLTQEELDLLERLPEPPASPYRLITIARLMPWKGIHLSLRAYAAAIGRLGPSEYWIVGSGPECERLKRLATELKLHEAVSFWEGGMSREHLLEKLSQTNVLIHPALREAFGNVCLEALAAGRPVICLDSGGPALQVDDEVGVCVPLIDEEQIIEGLSQAIIRLGQDSELRARMGRAARERARRCFSWDARISWVSSLYASVIKAADRHKP